MCAAVMLCCRPIGAAHVDAHVRSACVIVRVMLWVCDAVVADPSTRADQPRPITWHEHEQDKIQVRVRVREEEVRTHT